MHLLITTDTDHACAGVIFELTVETLNGSALIVAQETLVIDQCPINIQAREGQLAQFFRLLIHAVPPFIGIDYRYMSQFFRVILFLFDQKFQQFRFAASSSGGVWDPV
ncbi:MAG: hypothetical protein WCI88_14720 [Chloroflexota bacterium]